LFENSTQKPVVLNFFQTNRGKSFSYWKYSHILSSVFNLFRKPEAPTP